MPDSKFRFLVTVVDSTGETHTLTGGLYAIWKPGNQPWTNEDMVVFRSQPSMVWINMDNCAAVRVERIEDAS